MSDTSPVEFFEEPNKYTFYTREDADNVISCVVVEDEPGPYLDLVAEVVDSGQCKMALTAPFTDKTLALLSGQRVLFGDDESPVPVALPDLTRCVVVMDMRNDSSQKFAGYDPTKHATAGIQFVRQLPGFPGRLFFATRYGRELLDAAGISGAYGVVPLRIKAGYRGKMPREDREAIKTALGLALTHCAFQQLNCIEPRGDFFQIVYRGQITIAKNNVGARILYALLQAGREGKSDRDLCQAVGYKPQASKGSRGTRSITATEMRGGGLTLADEVEVITSEERKQARATLPIEKQARDEKRKLVVASRTEAQELESEAKRAIKDILAKLDQELSKKPRLTDQNVRQNLTVLRFCLESCKEEAEAGDVVAVGDMDMVTQLLEQIEDLDGRMLALARKIEQHSQDFSEAIRKRWP